MTLKITPAFVREAYSLLRQSIIHVEQDDIDFDEEELEGERGDYPSRTQQEINNQDVDMHPTTEGVSQEESSTAVGTSDGPGPAVATSSTQVVGSDEPAPVAQPKRRMIITHDKFMTLQSLIVMHLTEVERRTGGGVERDELIDWYLEQKEGEVQSVEELDYERELIMKMLKRLVKVRQNFS
jgi:DNA replication licensing factor MCM6